MINRILVAPLNWGLGHATRCIPIINALIKFNFNPIIASDGVALELLKKEFPELITLELPSYNIKYSKSRIGFKYKLLIDSPKIFKSIKAEKEAVKQIVKEYNITGIISDNRFGVYSKHMPSVFITHQLHVLSGNTTWLSTKLHEKFMKKFHKCWIPDLQDETNLSGALGHKDTHVIKAKYIGPLSRFTKKDYAIKNKIMVLLSGPEPQRTMLEKKLFEQLMHFSGTVLFVKGVVEEKQTVEKINHIIVYNYMTSEQLETSINESQLIISRSGYTTIMDLAKLNKKAFFIPTPGQFEQEYLAQRLDKLKLVPSCSQDTFNLNELNKCNEYTGLSDFEFEINYKKLFSLFKAK
ncbi:glycosyltransferase [Formosa maritima]|uniref:Glycosyltransferase n=1 Tax=Formosa maritima TaxID=2592046 RepID=A0A5D0G1P9_9FLAO|nr:glycosyltransferase [Formosa maritima]TYA53023.1 glycosyltransferase [Formosa maritima]